MRKWLTWSGICRINAKLSIAPTLSPWLQVKERTETKDYVRYRCDTKWVWKCNEKGEICAFPEKGHVVSIIWVTDSTDAAQSSGIRKAWEWKLGYGRCCKVSDIKQLEQCFGFDWASWSLYISKQRSVYRRGNWGGCLRCAKCGRLVFSARCAAWVSQANSKIIVASW